MAVICPSVLAVTKDQYHGQMEKIASFAERIQIDLTDGQFATSRTVKPQDAWWPVGIKADFHLMFRHPENAVDVILKHRPNMIIVHAEAEGNFLEIAEKIRGAGVLVGAALMPQTAVETVSAAFEHLDHVLIFSGNLGEYGGRADLSLLEKVQAIKQIKPGLEIGWDGGVSEQNISQLAFGGVDVFDVGGYLQKADDPARAFQRLSRIAEETGTA